jgi:hypothetical protein
MKTKIIELLDQYNLEYIINENNIEVSRNGKNMTLNLPMNIVDIEINLNLFCVYSPDPLNKLKENYPFYFETPKHGDLICVKKLGEWVDVYQTRNFKEFRNGKIVCFKEDENKEKEYEFYSMSDGINHPTTTFWHNGNQEHLTWETLENIMDENFKITQTKCE